MQESGRSQPYVVQLDYLLVLFVLVTTGLGLLVLRGSTSGVPGLDDYTAKQAEWWAISLGVFAVALIVPYRWLKVLGWPVYLVLIAALVLLAVGATHGWTWGDRLVKRGGAMSWIRLRQEWFIQPAEFAKIAVVIVLAHWLAWRQKNLTSIWECIVPVVLVAVPIGLLVVQPDLGTAMVFMPLPFILLFVAGLHWRVVLLGVFVGIVGLGAGLYAIYTAETTLSFLRPHQMKRIQVFRAPLEDVLRPIFRPFQPAGVEEALAGLSAGPNKKPPEAGEPGGEAALGSAEATREAVLEARKSAAAVWQIQQAEMALGSGRMFGKGWGKGTQSREGFLPAHYTDFIFCSLGEQFGMVGCFLLLGLYLLIAWRALHVAATTSDPFGRCLVVGLLAVILLHVFFNVGMTVRLLPVTGLPLPLMSYGGSFLATNYLILGLIANVSMRR